MIERAHRDEVEQLVSYADGKIDKAIISLILSSGMRPGIVRELTLKHLLDGCTHYFPDEEITIDKLKDKDPIKDNFIACFDIGTEDSPRVTCCSPEALSLMLDYIDEDRITFESESEKIFLKRNNSPLHDNYISDRMGKLNDAVGSGHRTHEFTRVTARNLVKSFKYVCDTYFDFDYKKDVIRLLEGSDAKANKEFYNAVREDRYLLIGPYLTIVDCLYLMPDRYTIEKYSGLNNDYDDIY